MAANSRTTKQFCTALFRDTPLEFRLLAACCIWPSEAGALRVHSFLESAPIEWQKLLDLAKRHRVEGFVANALKSQPGVPADVAQTLRNRGARIEREGLLQLAVARKLTHVMQQAKIPFVVMKGAPLAKALYGSITLRHSKDIDVLVNKADVGSTQALLLDNGFCNVSGLGANLTPRQVASWEEHRKHYDFKHVATGVHLELHWKGFDNARLATIAAEKREWSECSPGIHIPGLPREELFSILCAHGASHAWFRLKWLVDVATILAQSSPREQASLVRSAAEQGLGRPAEQAQLLCAGLFGDARIATPQKSTVIGRWLATVARDALEQEISPKSAEVEFVPKRLWLSRLLLRPGWVYRWTEAKVYATSPADWKTVRLPDWLHFAYPIIRIPLWLWRRWLPGGRRA